jgi:hypothetical protein
LTAAKSSVKPPLIFLESTARGRNDWLRERFAEPAPATHLTACGTWEKPPHTWLTLLDALPNESEDYLQKLVRLGRREGSLLMRVDSRGLHDTTYVFGKHLLKFRVRSLNCFRWNEPR